METERRSQRDLRAPEERARRAAKLADLLGKLSGHALQPPELHHAGQRRGRSRRSGPINSARANNETVPIVVDGLMFVTGPLNNAAALDARTGRPIWHYTRQLPQVASHCTVMTNRGFAILGDRLFMATLDTHLVSLDAKTGTVIWDVAVDDYQKGFSITHAPLAIDGKIIVGVTAGECGLHGFRRRLRRRHRARSCGEYWRSRRQGDPARATWAGNSAEFGGAPTWMTGTYDADTDTLFWPTGNPGPDYDGTVREGANLYSCSVLALDPEDRQDEVVFPVHAARHARLGRAPRRRS